MRHINRQVPIAKVARALDLRLDGAGKIGCWHAERHKNGDRTASVGIRATNNTVKCFGCDSRPIGPIDLVRMSWRWASLTPRYGSPGDSMCRRFRRAEGWRSRIDDGTGSDARRDWDLVKSGLWERLSEAAQSIAPVLFEMSEKKEPTDQAPSIQISYAALHRYSRLISPNAVHKALIELAEIGFLNQPEAGLRRSPERRAARYIVTPNSDEMTELANAFAAQMRNESVNQQNAIPRIARSSMPEASRSTQIASGAAA